MRMCLLFLMGLVFGCSSYPIASKYSYSDPEVDELYKEIFENPDVAPKYEFVEFTKQFKNTRGMYHQGHIYINQEKWNKSSSSVKRFIVLHELGHWAMYPHRDYEYCLEKVDLMCPSVSLVQERIEKSPLDYEKAFILDLKQSIKLEMYGQD